jgi:serine/threonine protein kinase
VSQWRSRIVYVVDWSEEGAAAMLKKDVAKVYESCDEIGASGELDVSVTLAHNTADDWGGVLRTWGRPAAAVCLARLVTAANASRSAEFDADVARLGVVRFLVDAVCAAVIAPAAPTLIDAPLPLSPSGSDGDDDGEEGLGGSASIDGFEWSASISDVSLDNSAEWNGGSSGASRVPGLSFGADEPSPLPPPPLGSAAAAAPATLDLDVHATAVVLLLSLLVARGDGTTLDARYCDRYPLDSARCDGMHALRSLAAHLNSPRVAVAAARVRTRAAALPVAPGVRRLLRLLLRGCFDPAPYGASRAVARRVEPEHWGWTHVADGVYGRVWAARGAGAGAAEEEASVAIKLLRTPAAAHDRCVVYDVYREVSALERVSAAAAAAVSSSPPSSPSPIACRLLDYGVTHHHYWLVFERCAHSLGAWCRDATPAAPRLAQRLDAFERAAELVCALHAECGLAHLDIKGDNILVRRGAEGGAEGGAAGALSLCLADFGSSAAAPGARSCVRGSCRGTEAAMAPEMLCNHSSTPEAPSSPLAAYSAATVVSTAAAAAAAASVLSSFTAAPPPVFGRACDAWALGCLAYELVTGELLFRSSERDGGDWTRFFLRVTCAAEALPPADAAARLEPDAQWLARFLQAVLVRDPVARLSAPEVLATFRRMRPARSCS